MTSIRVEADSLGEVEIPVAKLWGAQTQRSLEHFHIGGQRFRWPSDLIHAIGLIKKAAIQSNASLGLLPEELVKPMLAAADEVSSGKLDDHFPLMVFQTGSGTHTNMNVNEVIANRAIQLLEGQIGSKHPVHPNNHVNLGQSSNDVFPTAMHVVVINALMLKLYPALKNLEDSLMKFGNRYVDLVKSGRTHLQDAVPLTVEQEVSGWVHQLVFARSALKQAKVNLYPLAIGGTAVGTGLNTHPKFGKLVVDFLKKETGVPYSVAANRFAALSSHEPLVQVSAAMRTLAIALMKIANDIRWLGSGPIGGIGELLLPQNEPGSSIMPGKVNPSQCEALTMVCTQVFGNDACVAFAGSQGNFQLNVFKPVILHNILESIDLLTDSIAGFQNYCTDGITVDEQQTDEHLTHNLMLATVLNTHIGYDKAAEITKYAYLHRVSLKEASITLEYATSEQFDKWLDLGKMVQPI